MIKKRRAPGAKILAYACILITFGVLVWAVGFSVYYKFAT